MTDKVPRSYIGLRQYVRDAVLRFIDENVEADLEHSYEEFERGLCLRTACTPRMVRQFVHLAGFEVKDDKITRT